jgi:glycosyltransferase involved in cell wall biosynthesis
VSSRKLVSAAARPIRSIVGASRSVAVRFSGLPPAGEVHVWYGHRRVPRSGDLAVGGIVKLQELERRFPGSVRRFNLLYLVSSRLPEGPVALARAAQAKGAALVVNQNGVAYPGWHGPGWRRTNAPMAKLLRRADHVFYQSRFCQETADRFLETRPRRSEVLYNAVDTTRFAPALLDARTPLTMLLGGTQYAWYRVATALEVLALVRHGHPEARLLISGQLRGSSERTPRADFERLAETLRVREAVDLLGPYAQTEAPAIYQRAHLLLHTKYNDPCPTVVVEAMASGLPVVFSGSGGVPELVGDAGVGVPTEISWDRDIPPDHEAMARAVESAFERRRVLGAVARQRAIERFDLRHWISRHEDVFRGLVT